MTQDDTERAKLVERSQPEFLDHLREVNSSRLADWEGTDQKADGMFHAAELGGEVGELLNVVKKMHREAMGWRGSRATREQLEEEIGDVLICLDKLAGYYGVSIVPATIAKFNATSEKQGFTHRLSALSTGPSDAAQPIPMILHCPRCHLQHVDEPDELTPEWDNPPHRSHLCHGCGCIWRPADVATEGVAEIATVGKHDTPSAQERGDVAALRDECDVCGGSGRNASHQLWPNSRCRICHGSGMLPAALTPAPTKPAESDHG